MPKQSYQPWTNRVVDNGVKPATGKKIKWSNRIVGHGEEAPDQLLANPKNWRLHPQTQQYPLHASLESLGWIQDVIVNLRTSELWPPADRNVQTIVDGHLRITLALRHDQPSVPVKYVDLSPDEENLALTTLDPLSALAVADKEKLDALLREMPATMDVRLQEMIADLAKKEEIYLDNPSGEEVNEGPEPQIDRAEELREKWGTGRGQVWEISSQSAKGKSHRLMCGDGTKAENHDKLLNGVIVNLVLTDPPYGVGIDYRDYVDNLPNLISLIQSFMPLITRWPVVLLTCGNNAIWEYPKPKWVLAWVHPASNGSGPWGFTNFNPILAYGPDPYLAKGLGSRNDSIVMCADREGVEGHPVPKPIKLWSWLLERGSIAVGDCILDPFLGSGTTMVAAEKLGRLCYGMEIAPEYVAVCLERMADMGLEPHRV
jgi:hypothetical protein